MSQFASPLSAQRKAPRRPRRKYRGTTTSMSPRNLMDPYEGTPHKFGKVKETPELHGPMHKFEGGSRRPRNLTKSYIRTPQKSEGGSREDRNLVDPYINLNEGQGDSDASWTKTSTNDQDKSKFKASVRKGQGLSWYGYPLQDNPTSPS